MDDEEQRKAIEAERAKSFVKWCYSNLVSKSAPRTPLSIANPTRFPSSAPLPQHSKGLPPILNGPRERQVDHRIVDNKLTDFRATNKKQNSDQSYVQKPELGQASSEQSIKAVEDVDDGEDKDESIGDQLKKD